LLAGCRLALAAVALTAVVYQLVIQLRDRPEASVLNFFSFFTILSNIFGIVVLVLSATAVAAPRPHWLDLLRGAATLYLATTGVVVAVLLSNLPEEQQLTVGWVDTVVHRVMPIAVALDWLIDPPQTRIRDREALGWLAFPLAYVGYSLLRGEFVHWYPYPFLDHRQHGYPQVTVTCVIIAAAMAALSLLIPRVHAIRRR
jgi:hypothetical protein